MGNSHIASSLIMAAAFPVTVAAFLTYDHYHPLVCVEKAKVVEITAIDYRNATIKLVDGKEISVNQATLKPGDMYCLRTERQK